MGKGRKSESIVQRFVTEAVRLRAEALEVEYKDGYEQVFASKHRVGYGIGSLRSSSPEAATLRKELYEIVKRRRRVAIGAIDYELRGEVFDSFGEDAFRIDILPV